jgi:hypothetical protein
MKDTNVREVLGGGVKFYPELSRVDKEALIGVNFKLRDARVIEDWDGEFGTSSFALLLVEDEEGRRSTTSCGGKAVLRQVEKLLKFGKLPCFDRGLWCTMNKVLSENNREYYVLYWPETKVEDKAESADPAPAVRP